ncbi:hypothetical protein K443DRAFT_674122 [Laccaria amethystina LaAM-08-1]|jgi:hypothetical protein|uniref:Uncharacterized protein n=1 Tax=Laccaria amethystina LaAM-08-1 TaxID=1095629 RepID=A0A0C9WTU6_9AGAR|nr:hypothetical protein K443DRAFT_682922 [Laccaria amethystina LaAM-08-1]KIK02495.1 hypothetical protein K443DRAFT_677572 [Laccaria amethystina LaAM-08-1]KIK06466.1 hypothetical protein K443DRAFT_674122 [Laccaria amethystina LaAM-08-1]
MAITERNDSIHDLPTHNPKGRPQTQQLTSANEGCGGGPKGSSEVAGLNAGRRCGVCHQMGHNHTCPV